MEMNRRVFLAGAAAATAGLSLRAHGQDESKTYRACIIGDSKQGGYGHDIHLIFDQHERVTVVGLADPDEEGRAKHGAECKAATLYADYKEMLEKEKPDLVAVGPRWTVNHKEYLEACAAVGAHGFMEKPLCVDMAEADAMVAAVEAKNLKWAVAYNFRQTATMAHVKKCIMDDKLIGTVLEARSRGKEDGRAGAEDMIVLGTHLFDLMRYLMGEAGWCQADITHNGAAATAANVREATEALGPVVGNRIHATFGFSKGTAGHFSSMFTREGSGGRWGLDIYGTKGVISIKMDRFSRQPGEKPTRQEVLNSVVPEVTWLDDSGWIPRTGADGAVISAWKSLPDAPAIAITDRKRDSYTPIVADLIAAIEEDRLPATSLQDSAKAQEMIQAVFESHVAGKRVTLPLELRDHPLKRWS